jgi:glucose-6-phosphate isomerase
MPPLIHDFAPALAIAPLRAAFEKRRPAAEAALLHWRESQDKNFLALHRSLTRMDDLEGARNVVNHLTKDASDVIVLGIGGSSLGGQTLSQLAYWGTAAYAPRIGFPRLHFLDNLNGPTFTKLLTQLDLRSTRFHVVSKSGSTTEPILQMLAAIDALESAGGGKYLKHHFSGEAEPGENPLRSMLTAIGSPILDHDPNLGGRYTAFSTVGLVPAMLAGLDPVAIRASGREVMETSHCATDGAALCVAARDIGLSQHVMWAYADRLQRLTKWWRQLWAESLGKSGQGTTPLDALGPVDQHSQLQLYLDGPNDKFFTFIDAPIITGAKANAAWANKHGLESYAGRDISEVVAAQMKATVQTLSTHGRAVRRLSLTKPLDETGFGALMMHLILETLIAARLWNVDPFGQPAVEEGKHLTRKFLDTGA